MCCSVLPCAAVCCSVLPCAAVCCSVLQCVAASIDMQLICIRIGVLMCIAFDLFLHGNRVRPLRISRDYVWVMYVHKHFF